MDELISNLQGIQGPICNYCSYPSKDEHKCSTCHRLIGGRSFRKTTCDAGLQATLYSDHCANGEDSSDEEYTEKKGNDEGNGTQTDTDGNQSDTDGNQSDTDSRGSGGSVKKPKGSGRRKVTVVVKRFSKNCNSGKTRAAVKISDNIPHLTPDHPNNVAEMRRLENKFDLDDRVCHKNIKAFLQWSLAAWGYEVAKHGGGNVHKYPRYLGTFLESGHFNDVSEFVEANRQRALRVAREYAIAKAPTQTTRSKTWDQLTGAQKEALVLHLSKSVMKGFDSMVKALEWEAKGFGIGSAKEEEEEEETNAPNAPKRPTTFCNPVCKKPRLQFTPEKDGTDDEDED